jgi:muramoyltetrapeptide carboxypeptidase LdcA involved in peptidoglycan recycling
LQPLVKPPRLRAHDKVATLSLSWGGAGDQEFLWRYHQGKKRLQDLFGLEVVEMPHTLKGSEYIYQHPQKRAEDLMQAFVDPSIKAILSCIGGSESIRMLPYIDFSVIKKSPKILMGYSDTTVTHMICLKSGLSSFYGPSILAEFAENVKMHDYTVKWVNKILFASEVIGPVAVSPQWTSEWLEWTEGNKHIARSLKDNTGYEILQGKGITAGRLIGGCIDVLEFIKQTSLWPDQESWDDTILFFETSEEKPHPSMLERWLRNYGVQGILGQIRGMIWGKPYDNCFYDEYKTTIQKILREFDRSDLPVLYNASFGHTAPMITVPYGVLAEIDCTRKTWSILEPAVT